MVHAITIERTGGPEVLTWQEVRVDRPGPGEAVVRHTAVGVNFIDTYHRTGLYPVQLPAVLGMEAAGVVEEVGAGVSEVREGDRIVYGAGPIGGYAEARVVPAERLVRLPDAIDDRTAAAVFVKGLTVQYLLRRTHRVQPGESILWHAAAGGVGVIACQWAKHLGATVIGTVGSDAKADLVRSYGCDHPIVYTREDFVARVREITRGDGVPVVYDSVGKATWEGSLGCLRPLGLMVSFGNASGAVPPVQPLELTARGSLFLTRPALVDYTASREDLVAAADELFELVTSGAVKVEIGQEYPLREAARAHRDLEARRTTGSIVLIP